MKKNFKTPECMAVGQAGVYRVASELMLRGIRVAIPTVDDGVDLLLPNGGYRVQVKARRASRLCWREKTDSRAFAYHFRLGKKRYNPTRGWIYKKNNFTDEVDFFVFWGIDENRFFIVPSSEFGEDENLYFVIMRRDAHLSKQRSNSFRLTMTSFEDRWDLLVKSEPEPSERSDVSARPSLSPLPN